MSSSIFELRDGRYVAAIFWTAIEGTNGATIDMLGMLWRDNPGDPVDVPVSHAHSRRRIPG
jgi:hypothetical protein